MTFKPHVLKFTENTEFKWLGYLGFKGVFDGEHSFKIIDNGDGTICFEQTENFRGLLVNVFSKRMYAKTKNGFKQMNVALKKRAEYK